MHDSTDKSRGAEPLQSYDERMRAVDMDEANDFPEITPEVEATARRGPIAGLPGRLAQVRIDPDLQSLFPTEQAVNEALRGLAELAKRVEARRAG